MVQEGDVEDERDEDVGCSMQQHLLFETSFLDTLHFPSETYNATRSVCKVGYHPCNYYPRPHIGHSELYSDHNEETCVQTDP